MDRFESILKLFKKINLVFKNLNFLETLKIDKLIGIEEVSEYSFIDPCLLFNKIK
jgi:hypothetical protein